MSAQVTIVGRLGRDPEISTTARGGIVCRFSVVTSRSRKTEQGWEDVDTTWWAVTAFDRLGEHVAASLAKGQRVIVVGRAVERSWEKDGEKRSRVEVMADHVGPDLKDATASVVKADRYAAATTGPADPGWGAPTDEAPF